MCLKELDLKSRDLGLNFGFATCIISTNYSTSLRFCFIICEMALKMAIDKDVRNKAIEILAKYHFLIKCLLNLNDIETSPIIIIYHS